VTPAALLTRLLAAGFQFRTTGDSVEYSRPAADTPEIDELMGYLAWSWADLEDVARQHLITQPETCP